MNWPTRFSDFVARKTAAAAAARIPGYVTVESRASTLSLGEIGNPWTRDRFDGPFFESSSPDPTLPALNTVFVQSADGNTGTNRPIELGGGMSDKHLIYEGLSSVHADAIITGAATIRGDQVVMANWHPELVALRASLGLNRYPAQVVVTRSGRLDIDSALMFNVPELRVFIVTNDEGALALAPATASRPWIHVLTGGSSSDLVAGLRTLRCDHGLVRLSSVGGRTLATELIDAGLIQDLYLTTSATTGGEPGTPFYIGGRRLDTTRVVKKAGRDEEAGVVFEHLILNTAGSVT